MIAAVLAAALLGVDASPSPAPHATSTPGPVTQCAGSSALLAQLNRPTIGFSACAVEPHAAVLEHGYQVQQFHAQSLVQYQSFERFGVAQNLEIDSVGPVFNKLVAQGPSAAGLSDTGIGAKYQFPLRGAVIAAVDGLYTTPNGASAFTTGSSTETLNLDAGTSVSDRTGVATTLAVVHTAQLWAFMPSVVLAQQVASNSQLYVEYVADSNIGGGLGGRAFLDYGFQQLFGPDVEVDIERGSTFTPLSGKGFRYFGIGFALKLPLR